MHRRLRPCDAADVGAGAVGEHDLAIGSRAAPDLRVGVRGPQRARCASQRGETAGHAETHRPRLAAGAGDGEWMVLSTVSAPGSGSVSTGCAWKNETPAH